MNKLEAAKIEIVNEQILSTNWHPLKKITYTSEIGGVKTSPITREIYDLKDGAAILLYNVAQKTVILTAQFRLPVYLYAERNGESVEACAGKLDRDTPEVCAVREAFEETGYQVVEPEKLFSLYTSPGAVAERIHFFIAEYSPTTKTGKGGGLEEEHEDITVIELTLTEAMEQVKNAKITDAKTVILLQHLMLSGRLA